MIENPEIENVKHHLLQISDLHQYSCNRHFQIGGSSRPMVDLQRSCHPYSVLNSKDIWRSRQRLRYESKKSRSIRLVYFGELTIFRCWSPNTLLKWTGLPSWMIVILVRFVWKSLLLFQGDMIDISPHETPSQSYYSGRSKMMVLESAGRTRQGGGVDGLFDTGDLGMLAALLPQSLIM
ncbi:hypothetical protein J6590_043554 [Homalodisca vitripennis]|nr:hypothetical protein J6590_043554 [Homalodisca vitripennis]